jgi:hypothetical protein
MRRVLFVSRGLGRLLKNYHTTPRNTPEERNFINIAAEA